MTPPIIIALSGLSGAGKSTVAKALAKMFRIEHVATIAPFANDLKQHADGLGWDDEKDAKGRRLLEGLTVLMEEYEPGHWARRWESRWLNGRFNMMIYPKVIIAPDHRGVPGFDALIDNHGDKDGKGFRFTIQRADCPAAKDSIKPRILKLRRWDLWARQQGIPIDNNAPDHGAAAAAEIWARVKATMGKETGA